MAAPGTISGTKAGPDEMSAGVLNNSVSAYTMPSLNNGICFRFRAPDTRDVLTVYVLWTNAATPGVVECRIETIDATTGKPTGTLYDANATKSQAPATGWQAFTFASAPTTGLTAGTEYGIVLITTTGGTTQTMRVMSVSTSNGYPCVYLTAADGTTRSNFAEVTASIPVCTLVFEDSVEEANSVRFCPIPTRTVEPVYGTLAVAQKFVIPTGQTWIVRGVQWQGAAKTGTPAGDLIVDIIPSGTITPSQTITIDKDSLLTGLSNNIGYAPCGTPLSLAAGTYYVSFRSPSSANSSNCWNISTGTGARSAAVLPTGFLLNKSADITANPITWSETTTAQAGIWLVLDSISTSAGGGLLTHPGMSGGMRG